MLGAIKSIQRFPNIKRERALCALSLLLKKICWFSVLRTENQQIFLFFTAKPDQTRHNKGRRAKPRIGFYILICGGFETKLL
jgi:hypothetical protein